MRWKAKVAYDGTQFEGWQSQLSGNTVQDFIEKRLSFLMKEPIRIHASGRTDSGVHAKGQVFHFDADWKHGIDALINALRTGFPHTIQVYDLEVVDDTFHARFSVKGKRYAYQLVEGYASPFDLRYAWSLGKRKLDLERINTLAQSLLGKHDFSSFITNNGSGIADDPVKDLRRLDATRVGEKVWIRTEASGYGYKMVRSLVGCLVDVGCGKLESETVLNIFHEKRRSKQIYSAPPQGLFLEEVYY